MATKLALDEKMIALNQQVATQSQGIQLAGQLLVDGGCVEPGYIDSMKARNDDVSVYMGNFVAIPHGNDDGKQYIKKTGISVVQVPTGVDWGDPDNPEDEKIVTVIFGIAGKNGEHLDLLSKIALYCSDVENVAKLADAQTTEEVMNLLREVD